MATIGDIGVAAGFNILGAFIFLLAFAILRLQPLNDRVYFPKWYLRNLRTDPTTSGAFVSKFVNLDFRSYIRFLNWVPDALKMPEPALIEHAGLDSAVYLRIYLIGLKIFVPIAFLAWAILVPLNWTNITLEHEGKIIHRISGVDKLSIANIPVGSQRFWGHVAMAYAFTFWTCYVLRKEYETVALMRLQFLASEKRRPDQFTVLVRNVPPDPDESTWELAEHFFLFNHPDQYLTHQVVYDANKLYKLVKKKKNLQNWLVYYENKYNRNSSQRPFMKTGFLGLWGKKVDAIDHHVSEIEKLSEEISVERERIAGTPKSKSIMPAAFVSFRSRWGAAVCAQTQQSKNQTIWLTEWAPEPCDVYWRNLAIPYVSLTVRWLVVAVAFFFLTFFSMIPIAFVQSLATIEGIEKAAPFLRDAVGMIPKTIGVAIPMRATFFVTYIMVDGWLGLAGEILMWKPLIFYHLKNFFLVKTEKDRCEAADPGSLGFNTGEPIIQFYFLLGLVHATMTPIILPFIIIFFSLAYIVFRHQIINVYNQEYENAAAFWPDVHGRVITSLVISQVLLMGLLSTKQATQSTPTLIALPVLTIWFHWYFCKGRYESAFVKYPLQEAMMKDTLERAKEPNLNLKEYLQNAYEHPVFKASEDEEDDEINDDGWENESVIVPTKHQPRRINTPVPSKISGASSSSLPEAVQELPQP
ncbi:protein OSCA1-like isoform X3 [Quercus lobata]|uniref:protein OSCA1-like isoform X3 n=1 Tax=Quercus lobata TaxID=97700 RepID=UPI001246A810|nr:protein OSCA1-like isoform X3 [Quercus lobata]